MTETLLKLYENVGKPDRAVIKLSEPTRVWTGLRRHAVVTQFEAYITVTATNKLGYYINPNSHHSFYMPENVIEFIPVDTMELWRRARKAAEHIKADRVHGRELDNAFENYDSDEMCAAIWRIALKSEKLMNAIKKVWSNGQDTFTKNYEKFSSLTDKELSEHAKKTRESERITHVQ